MSDALEQLRPLKPGDHVRIPDRLVNAWGHVLEVQGDLVRVKVGHSATTTGRITWYRRIDLFTSGEYRRDQARRSMVRNRR